MSEKVNFIALFYNFKKHFFASFWKHLFATFCQFSDRYSGIITEIVGYSGIIAEIVGYSGILTEIVDVIASDPSFNEFNDQFTTVPLKSEN